MTVLDVLLFLLLAQAPVCVDSLGKPPLGSHASALCQYFLPLYYCSQVAEITAVSLALQVPACLEHHHSFPLIRSILLPHWLPKECH